MVTYNIQPRRVTVFVTKGDFIVQYIYWFFLYLISNRSIYCCFVAGVGMLTRKVGNSVSPVVELTKADDGKYVLSSNSAFKNTSITFNLNEEFDEDTPDGRKVRSVITQDGNKLVHTQKTDKQITTILREFQPEELKMVKQKRSHIIERK